MPHEGSTSVLEPRSLIPSSSNSDTALRAKSNAKLMEEERAQAETEAEEFRQRHSVGHLASFIQGCFDEAERHWKDHMEPRLRDCLRRKKGEYDPERLALIEQAGGAQTYANITRTKTSAAENWLTDTILPAGDNPFSLVATPIPELSDEEIEKAVRGVQLFFQQANITNPSATEIRDQTLEIHDKMLDEVKRIADQKVAAHEQKIKDQFLQGGWHNALKEFNQHLTIYPIAILKGPIIRRKSQMSYKNGEVVVTEEIIPVFNSVSAWDFYPAPNARDVNDNYLCERIRMSPRDLNAMINVEGWNGEAIRGAIQDHKEGRLAISSANDSGQAEREREEGRDTNVADTVSTILEGVNFWGAVPVSMLTEWGLKSPDLEGAEPTEYREISAIKFGNHVVQAILNPDPLDQRPYYVTSWSKLAGSIYGEAICELMADAQNNHNAAIRNMISNLALSSGPQYAVDIDALDPAVDATKHYPGKVWQFHGMNTSAREPITFFQPQSNSQELMVVAQYFEDKADDRTNIPRFIQGDSDIGGAGDTFSGLSLLQDNASKGIKQVVINLDDDIVNPCVKQLYRWNLMYLGDRSIQADAQIVAKGILATLNKDQVRARLQEFLANTMNDVDVQIIKHSGRAKLLREVAKSNNINPDDIIPEDKELLALDEQKRQEQAQIFQQQFEAAQGNQGGQS